MRLKQLSTCFAAALLISVAIVYIKPADVSAASFNSGQIISDSTFTNKSSMSVNDIQNFLNQKNSVCLKNYQTPEPLGNNNYGSNVSAARANSLMETSNLALNNRAHDIINTFKDTNLSEETKVRLKDELKIVKEAIERNERIIQSISNGYQKQEFFRLSCKTIISKFK